MATEISGRNYEIPPDIRDLVEKKLAKIQEKLFDDVIDVRVVLQVEKYRNICEILIKGKEHDVKTVQESDDSMQDAINAALDHLKRQAQKNRKKIRDHHRKEGNGRKVTEWAVQVLEPGQLREETQQRAPRIVKTNNISIRPMSIEEAALRLDESKNEFIVFRDIDTDRVSVIYKRRDNNLGLIAPEF
ncbi:MAG: ribosome-associated translation inhibitor RaiA [Acidobacteria bacterium]|nr:ribosome-associated translation inhibitor RaiA [Acidobacteriota bacterium]MBV9474606.1 ribosome-associated translation inhibitor RaiA [Acidobacteriota bacterium]